MEAVEKYFPLDVELEGKGILLSFEEFFHNRKRLDAGDVIQFERHRRDSERLFIGWRRRDSAGSGGGGGWNRGGLYSSTSTSSAHPYPVEVVQNHGVVTVPYQPADDCLHAGLIFFTIHNSFCHFRTLFVCFPNNVFCFFFFFINIRA